MGKHEDINSNSVDIYSSAKKAKKKKKMSRGKKAVTIILSVIIAICLVFSGLLIFALNYFKYNKTTVDESLLGINSEDSEDGIQNIAVFGIDTRDPNSFKGLSDTIMILSVNHDTKKIKIISVMRDSLVMVNGKGRKINSAYSLGGAPLAIKTLNETFGLDISDYATMNFNGVANLIDAVGGIETEVTQAEIDGYLGVNDMIREQAAIDGITPPLIKKPGVQTLNGLQAVSWARIRHVATSTGERDDYGRTYRQRFVMTQLFQKAKDLSLLKFPAFIKAMLPYAETSLSYNELIKLVPTIKAASLEANARIPFDNCVIPNSPVTGAVYYNIDYASKLIKAYIYDNIEFAEYAGNNPIDKTRWYK